MNFEFIQELSEARIFRNSNTLKIINTSDLADEFFNVLLAVQILKNINPKFAKKYADMTLSHGPIDFWKVTATDMHNMAYLILNQSKCANKLNVNRHITLSKQQLLSYLRNISHNSNDVVFDRKFFLRLQKDLGINSQSLKTIRRIVVDWQLADTVEKNYAASKIMQNLNSKLQNLDLVEPFQNYIGKKNLIADITSTNPAYTLGKFSVNK